MTRNRHIRSGAGEIADAEDRVGVVAGEGEGAGEALRRHGAILEAVAFAAERFLRPGDLPGRVDEALRRLGEAAGVTRVWAFRNDWGPNDVRLFSLWRICCSPGFEVDPADPRLRSVSYRAAGYERWEEQLGLGRAMSGRTREFPEGEQPLFRAYDIRSVAVVPIFSGDEWWGFLGFDDCEGEREWSTPELDALRAAASTLGAAFERERHEARLRRLNSQLEAEVERRTESLRRSTDQERATQASLRQSEARYRQIVETAAEGVWLFDPIGRTVLVNRRMAEMVGLTPDGMVGRPLRAFLPETDDEKADRFLHDLRLGRHDQIDIPLTCRDGEEVWTLMSTSPMHDDEGACVGALAMVTDITERRRVEETNRRLATITDQSDDMIVITDTTGRIVYVNPAFERTTGYCAREALGRDAGLTRCEDGGRSAFDDPVERVLRGEVWRGRLRRRRKDGSTFETETTVSPVRDASGEVSNCVFVSRDRTREIELETRLRQAQKMEAIGTLAGGVAHDFNNILGAVLGYTELALGELPADNRARRNLAEVMKAGERAADLVKHILTFSRQTEQEPRPVKLQPILKEALRLLRGSLPSTIGIRARVGSEVGHVLADPTQIHQVVMNLCTNAYHAMRPGGGTLTVGYETLALDEETATRHMDLRAGDYAVIEVSDTGCGMDPGTRERIFEPYFTTKEQGEGTGLGLATVHGIVQAHGGAVHVESEPGQGTTFRVYLPVCAGATDGEAAAAGAPAASRGSERVLFVDDEESIVRLAQVALARFGYEVTAVSSSVEALRLFEENPDAFDVVVTDLTMPRMTGGELTRRLLALRPDLPVVMCTGFSETLGEEEARAIGVREYILKPIITSNLAAALRSALDSAG